MKNDGELFAGRYQILERIAGGSSIVRKARDPLVGRMVAIKTPSDVVVATTAMYERFIEEARMLGRLSHPGILRILHFYEMGEVDDRCHLVSDWMDQDLETLADRNDLDWRAKLRIMNRILDAIGYLHSQGIVHRDLKPRNVLLSADLGDIRVADLGIARANGSSSHTARATFRFVAPESLKVDATPNPQFDIYSLGITFFELLAGHEKFTEAFPEIFRGGGGAEGDVRWLNWHMDASRKLPDLHEVDPEIPGLIAKVVARMAEKDPALRYKDIAEIRAALSPLSSESGEQDVLEALEPEDFAARSERASPSKKSMSRGKVIALSVAGFLVLAIGILVIPEILGGSAPPAPVVSGEVTRLRAAVRKAEALQVAPDVPALAQARQLLAVDTSSTPSATFSEAAKTLEAALAGAPRLAKLGTTPEALGRILKECTARSGDCAREEFSDEVARSIRLTPFALDTHEISNGEFAKFVREKSWTTYPERSGFVARFAHTGTSVKVPGASWKTLASESPGGAEFPVRGVSLRDAEQYCAWAGRRLPTEDEWEYAAQSSGDAPEAWRATLAQVNAAPASGRFGVKGLVGNVWEWTRPTLNPAGPGILKGGSWLETEPARRRPAARRFEDPGEAQTDDGFRCARDVTDWPEPSGDDHRKGEP